MQELNETNNFALVKNGDYWFGREVVELKSNNRAVLKPYSEAKNGSCIYYTLLVPIATGEGLLAQMDALEADYQRKVKEAHECKQTLINELIKTI